MGNACTTCEAAGDSAGPPPPVAAGGGEIVESRRVSEAAGAAVPRLRQELEALKLSQLKRRALVEFEVGHQALEAADDSDDVKRAVIDMVLRKVESNARVGLGTASAAAAPEAELTPLVMSASAGGSHRPPSPSDELAALREELKAPRKMSELKKRAAAEGVGREALDAADDADEPRAAVVELIVAAAAAAASLAAGTEAGANTKAVAELRVELQGLAKLSELKKRALADGAGQDEIDEADDAADPRSALVELIVAAADTALRNDVGKDAEADTAAELRSELGGLNKLSQLKKRAVAEGVSQDEIEEAIDADEPRVALVELIVAAAAVSVGGIDAVDDAAAKAKAFEAELRSELGGLKKLSQLKKRAVAEGVSQDEIEEAIDADEPRVALVELIVAAAAAAVPEQAGGVERSKASVSKERLQKNVATSDSHEVAARKQSVPSGRPHFGCRDDLDAETVAAQQGRPQTAAGRSIGIVPNGKHAMLSYQWDHQNQVQMACTWFCTFFGQKMQKNNSSLQSLPSSNANLQCNLTFRHCR
jgi:hypothetical protein